MIIKSDYIFLSSINDLYTYLLTGQINNNIYKYYDKVIIKHFVYDTNNRESLRIWKTNSVLDLWYDDITAKGYNNFILGVDYTITPDKINIDYLCVNDIEMHETFHNEKYFSEDEAKYLIKCITQHMANKTKNKKLFIDVHENLREYNKYYKDEGFILTGERASYSPHWIECVKDM